MVFKSVRQVKRNTFRKSLNATSYRSLKSKNFNVPCHGLVYCLAHNAMAYCLYQSRVTINQLIQFTAFLPYFILCLIFNCLFISFSTLLLTLFRSVYTFTSSRDFFNITFMRITHHCPKYRCLLFLNYIIINGIRNSPRLKQTSLTF